MKRALFVLSLVTIFLLVYFPHYNYDYPLHVDEWHHINSAMQLSSGVYDFSSFRVFEIGYHVFLAGLDTIGFDLVLGYKYLPGFFSVVAAIFLFKLVYFLKKDYWTALFSILFFSSIQSNVNILGLWFATPFTFALPIIFLGLYLFSKKNFKMFILCIFVLLFVHPISGFFLLILSIIHLTRTNLKNFKKLLSLAVLLIPVIFFIVVSKRPLSWFFKQILFEKGWTLLEPSASLNSLSTSLFGKILNISPYYLPLFFGIVLFAVSMYGLFSNKKSLFSSWFFYTIVMIFIFVNFNISPFVPYQRIVYLAAISLAVLAGVGLSKLIRKRNIITKVVIICIVFIFAFYSYGNVSPGTEPYHIIDDVEYKALFWLRAIDANEYVIAPLSTASAVFPISNNHALASSYFGGDLVSRQATEEFYTSDCNSQQKILQDYQIKYVYSRNKLGCAFLTEIYSNLAFIYLFEN